MNKNRYRYNLKGLRGTIMVTKYTCWGFMKMRRRDSEFAWKKNHQIWGRTSRQNAQLWVYSTWHQLSMPSRINPRMSTQGPTLELLKDKTKASWKGQKKLSICQGLSPLANSAEALLTRWRRDETLQCHKKERDNRIILQPAKFYRYLQQKI